MSPVINRYFWKALLAVVGLLLAVALLLVWMGLSRQSVPGPDAIRALDRLSDNTALKFDYGDWFVISPRTQEPKAGLIIYPGAHSAVRGYVQIMSKIAEAGYLVVAPKMPLGYAFLAPNKAEDVFQAYPAIEDWFLAGHSLGGAMAGLYAHSNADKLAGLVFLDSYPPESKSLADSRLPTLLIHRATPR